MAEAMAQEVGTSQSWLDLTDIYLFVTDIYQDVMFSDPQLARLIDPALQDTPELDDREAERIRKENDQKARQYCVDALRAVKKAAEASQLPEVKRKIAKCYLRMADVRGTENELEKARKCCLSAIEIQKALHKDAPTPENTHDLFEAYKRMGEAMEWGKPYEPEVEEQEKQSFRDKVKALFRKVRLNPYQKKAYRLIRKLMWNCPMISSYREECEFYESSLGMKNGKTFWTVLAVCVGVLGMGASAYYYNYLNNPADLLYWLLTSPALWGMWGVHRITEAKRFRLYRDKVRKKGRKARIDYFEKVCKDLQFGCMYVVVVTMVFALLFEIL